MIQLHRRLGVTRGVTANPRHSTPPQWAELVRLWNRCRGGMGGLALLPDAGGVNDQAAWTMAALGMIGSIHAEQEEYERKAGGG